MTFPLTLVTDRDRVVSDPIAELRSAEARLTAANRIIVLQNQANATLFAALLEIRNGLADTGTGKPQGERWTRMNKEQAWQLACGAIAMVGERRP